MVSNINESCQKERDGEIERGGGVEERKREGRVKSVTSERHSSPLTFYLFSHLNNPFHLSVVMHGGGPVDIPPISLLRTRYKRDW